VGLSREASKLTLPRLRCWGPWRGIATGFELVIGGFEQSGGSGAPQPETKAEVLKRGRARHRRDQDGLRRRDQDGFERVARRPRHLGRGRGTRVPRPRISPDASMIRARELRIPARERIAFDATRSMRRFFGADRLGIRRGSRLEAKNDKSVNRKRKRSRNKNRKRYSSMDRGKRNVSQMISNAWRDRRKALRTTSSDAGHGMRANSRCLASAK